MAKCKWCKTEFRDDYGLGQHIHKTEHPVEMMEGKYEISLPLGYSPRSQQALRYFARAQTLLESRYECVQLAPWLYEKGAVVTYLASATFPYDAEEAINENKSEAIALPVEPIKTDVPRFVESLSLSKEIIHALSKASVFTVDDIVAMSAAELLQIRRLGVGRLLEIMKALRPYGLQINGAEEALLSR